MRHKSPRANPVQITNFIVLFFYLVFTIRSRGLWQREESRDTLKCTFQNFSVTNVGCFSEFIFDRLILSGF